ncbi:hypothetical protein IT087_04360 [Candidatus Uhrbacteria bacterium]|nr:hypothetical protein [Candidatus Uhrbacteria bacterium]
MEVTGAAAPLARKEPFTLKKNRKIILSKPETPADRERKAWMRLMYSFLGFLAPVSLWGFALAARIVTRDAYDLTFTAVWSLQMSVALIASLWALGRTASRLLCWLDARSELVAVPTNRRVRPKNQSLVLH